MAETEADTQSALCDPFVFSMFVWIHVDGPVPSLEAVTLPVCIVQGQLDVKNSQGTTINPRLQVTSETQKVKSRTRTTVRTAYKRLTTLLAHVPSTRQGTQETARPTSCRFLIVTLPTTTMSTIYSGHGIARRI